MCGGSPKATPAPPPAPPAPTAPLKIGGDNVDDTMAAIAGKKTGKRKLTIPLSDNTGSPLTIPA